MEEIGCVCKRSSAEPGNIIKGVISELLNCDIVLAVITDFNVNVWYELGIRHARRNGTIMMIERGQKLPFDIHQYSVIEYDDRITGATKFKQDFRNFIQIIESQKPIDSSAMDFIQQNKTGSLNQREEELQKTYEDKLEKILQLVQGIQQDRTITSAESKQITNSFINKNILWVDDNPSNNESIIDVYGLQDINFDLALNTSQAVDYIASKNYAFVISDMGRRM